MPRTIFSWDDVRQILLNEAFRRAGLQGRAKVKVDTTVSYKVISAEAAEPRDLAVRVDIDWIEIKFEQE